MTCRPGAICPPIIRRPHRRLFYFIEQTEGDNGMNYTLNTTDHRFMYTVETLTDESGNKQEFKGRTKKLAWRKVFDHIGREKATIITGDYSLLKARKLGEVPLNITVKYEVARR
jgi:hypothetical protein